MLGLEKLKQSWRSGRKISESARQLVEQDRERQRGTGKCSACVGCAGCTSCRNERTACGFAS